MTKRHPVIKKSIALNYYDDVLIVMMRKSRIPFL